MKEVGIKLTYGEPVETAKNMGTYRTVGDREHAEIIQTYSEGEMGMVALAKKIGRSSHTVMEHIKEHNEAVEKSGLCPVCKRIKSDLATVSVSR